MATLPAASSAQTPGWAVDRTEPAPAGDPYFFQTHFPRFLDRPATISFAAVNVYAYRPLVASVQSDAGTQQVDAIQHSFATHFQANLQLAQRLGIDLSIPVYWLQTGSQDPALPVRAPSGVSAGDLRLGVRLRIVGRAERDPASLALAANGSFGFIPTAGSAQTTSDGAFRARVLAVGAGSAGVFRWSVSAGVNARPGIDLPSVHIGSEMFALAGAGVAVLRSKLFVGLETELATALATPFESGTNHAQVWALARASVLDDALQIGAGVGPGLSQAPGTPSMSAFVSLSYTAPLGASPRARHDETMVTAAATPVVATSTANEDIALGATSSAPPIVAREHPTHLHASGAPDDGIDANDTASAAPNETSVAPGDEQSFCDVPGGDECSTGDADHDGVREPLDVCASEPAGDHPDPTRPGCPDGDADGDGVFDHNDACPSAAQGTAPDPERRGCPLPDADGDRIPDDVDHCPTVPGAPHPDPTLNGCPGLVRLEANTVEILEPIFFATNRDVIQRRSTRVLQALADALNARTDIRYVLIAGHTDDQGNDELNVDLSQRRAAAVLRWLVAHGVSPARLQSRGLGSHAPRVEITPRMPRRALRDARARNRRVEFEILDDATAAANRARRASPSPAPGAAR